MAHQMIKYRLTTEGTIPAFVCASNESMGGSYGVNDSLVASPRDWLLVDISEDGATGDFEAIASQADLATYLTSISADWTSPSPDPTDSEATVPFDPTAQAAWAWGKLDALNA
jgi:hypothetical protein|tara:strand:+ start:290 stop:628 length:339 start_codon:yes stop_codon:yes gene_type:complete